MNGDWYWSEFAQDNRKFIFNPRELIIEILTLLL